jgi:hypothetical protein
MTTRSTEETLLQVGQRNVSDESLHFLAKRYGTSHTSIKRWKDSLSFGDLEPWKLPEGTGLKTPLPEESNEHT